MHSKLIPSLFITSLFVYALSAFPQIAGGGGHPTGGGGVAICPHVPTEKEKKSHDLVASAAVKDAIPLDLFQFGKDLKHSEKLTAKQLDRYLLKRLAPEAWQRKILEDARNEFRTLFDKQYYDRNPMVGLSTDLFEEFSKGDLDFVEVRGCELANAFKMYFDDHGNEAYVRPDWTVLDQMPNYAHNIVVMHWHEVLYRIARSRHQAKNSKNVRKMLAEALSKQMMRKGYLDVTDEYDRNQFQAVITEFWNTDPWIK